MSEVDGSRIREALEEERELVVTLGGFGLQFAGGILVTHERVPVPRFNFVQELRVARERQSAFFERALDHYFQRTLRPSFRVPLPVPPFVDRTLTGLGFVARTAPLSLMLSVGRRPVPRSSVVSARPAVPEELDEVVAFWAGLREQEELRRGIDVAWHHPNPDEEMVPWVAVRGATIVAAAIVHRYRAITGIHAVATRADQRGRGAATTIVQAVVTEDPRPSVGGFAMWAESERLEQRLGSLAFDVARQYSVYELSSEAGLTIPDPGPPTPPRWRPPRRPRS